MMTYEIGGVDVWAAKIKDRPGGVAAKLEALAEAGASLDFVIARRAPEEPGAGVVFVAPVFGNEPETAAAKAEFKRTSTLHSVRLSGPDVPGLIAKASRLLGDAGINMRGISAAALGERCVVYFAFDNDTDAAEAERLLQVEFNGG